MRPQDLVRLFGMHNLQAESELRKVSERYSLVIRARRDAEASITDTYFPQFTEALRTEAGAMARHYEIFYCLERSIRDLISDRLEEAKGATWWTDCVPEVVRRNVESNMKREIDSGVTVRSEKEIDYTNFGELGEIIKANWTFFLTFLPAFARLSASLAI